MDGEFLAPLLSGQEGERRGAVTSIDSADSEKAKPCRASERLNIAPATPASPAQLPLQTGWQDGKTSSPEVSSFTPCCLQHVLICVKMAQVITNSGHDDMIVSPSNSSH